MQLYHPENAPSHVIWEAEQGRAWSVLGWLTLETNGTWGGLEGGWSVGQRGSPAPLLCPGETTPGILCPAVAPQFQQDRELLERVQRSHQDAEGSGASPV